MSAPINTLFDPVGAAIRGSQALPLSTVGNVLLVAVDGHLNAEIALGSAALTSFDGTTIVNNAGVLSAVNSVFLVADLPLAASHTGMRAFVSDSTQTLAAGIGTHVAGSGGDFNPVFSDGTNWIIG